jgi:hypothetical protein
VSSSFTTFALFILAVQDTPPPDLVRQVAAREALSESARANYLYRQDVTIEEFGGRLGSPSGSYRETREVLFTPEGKRIEQFAGKPDSRLQRLILTGEDFADIRNIQPLLLTPDLLPRYQITFRGDETIDGTDCWVLQIKPRQILQGMRLFDGLAWIHKQSLSIIRTHGQAVPPIYSHGSENLFPRFTTIRTLIDGHYFPALTHADDTLPFKTGPLRMKLSIRYTGYRKFTAESKITFDPPQ